MDIRQHQCIFGMIQSCRLHGVSKQIVGVHRQKGHPDAENECRVPHDSPFAHDEAKYQFREKQHR